MSRVLVTGAAGLIGSHLIRELAGTHEVVGLARHPLPADVVAQGVRHLPLDLATAWDASALPPRADAVIHLAQSEHFREFPEQAEDVFAVNTVSTLKLLDYARRAGARTFVLASSGGIYGNGDEEFSEESQIVSRGDLGFYLGTKFCAEILSENYTAYMNVVVLRFFFVYGPGQKRGMLIPRLVHSVREGQPITLQGADGIRINPTYVADAVDAIRRTLTLDASHKINVGGPEALSLREIGETIGRAVGREPVFTVQADAVPRHLLGDVRKMADLLGKPQVGFASGIARYLEAEGLAPELKLPR